jgi:hypothetical protein
VQTKEFLWKERKKDRKKKIMKDWKKLRINY